MEKSMEKLKRNIKQLINIVNELEKEFPEKHFTLDGHLIGSIGEIFASYYYGIELHKNNSYKQHDGVVNEKEVQIKTTQGDSIQIKTKPDYLIVLFLNKEECDVYEVYNGPGNIAIAGKNKNSNNEYSLSLLSLHNLNKDINDKDKITEVKPIKKWKKGMKN